MKRIVLIVVILGGGLGLLFGLFNTTSLRSQAIVTGPQISSLTASSVPCLPGGRCCPVGTSFCSLQSKCLPAGQVCEACPVGSIACLRGENCCVADADCSYISQTGGCNTPEYVTRITAENIALGISIGEAPPRDNVTCTCESNQCITHG